MWSHHFIFGRMAQNCWCFALVCFGHLKPCKVYEQREREYPCSLNSKMNEQLLNHHGCQEMEPHQYPRSFLGAPLRLHSLPHPQITTVLNSVWIIKPLLFIVHGYGHKVSVSVNSEFSFACIWTSCEIIGFDWLFSLNVIFEIQSHWCMKPDPFIFTAVQYSTVWRTDDLYSLDCWWIFVLFRLWRTRLKHLRTCLLLHMCWVRFWQLFVYQTPFIEESPGNVKNS